MTCYAPLPDRAVFAISGEDSRDFLQGLITKDVKHIAPGKAVFSALLSPQGRFLFDFFITEHEGKLLVETEKARMGDLIKRLTLYRLRSKVKFEELPLSVAAVWNNRHPEPEAKDLGESHEILRFAQDDGGITFIDPRLPELGWRMLASPPPVGGRSGGGLEKSESHRPPPRPSPYGGGSGDYDSHRLSLGVPDSSKDLVVDRSILLEYGYDELHAVDFDKGCYVGQEVTARSKHRATLRKFIHKVQGDAPLPAKETPVMAGEREVGTMASSNGTLGLAHLKLEEVARAAAENIPLAAGGVKLVASLPGWCKTNFAA